RHIGHGAGMIAQDVYRLTALGAPEPHRSILASRGDPLAIRTVSDSGNRTVMTPADTHLSPTRDVPLAQCPVCRPGDDLAAIGTEGETVNSGGVAAHRGPGSTGRGIPPAHGAVFAGRGQFPAVWAEGQVVDPARAGQMQQLFSRWQVEHSQW